MNEGINERNSELMNKCTNKRKIEGIDKRIRRLVK